jgi:hypothetical protein
MASRERKKPNLNQIKEDEKYELKSFVISFVCSFLRIERTREKLMKIISFSSFNFDFCGFEKQ